MKKSLILITILASTLLFSKCYLDTPSVMSLSANNELSEEDIDKMLNGIYYKTINSSSYAYLTLITPELMADNIDPVKFQFVQCLYAYEHTAGSNDVLSSWYYSNFYNAIARCNDALKSPSINDRQKAQAMFCRAYNHIKVMEIYGPVPYITEDWDYEPISPLSVTAVYDKAIEDLEWSRDHGASFNVSSRTSSYMYPTSEAAQALLARVLRWRGNIAEAGRQAEALITSGKFTLASDPKGSSESEYIMNFKSLPGISNNYADWGYILSWEASNWNCFAAHPDLYDLAGANDTRRAFFDFDEAPARDGYVMYNKYEDGLDGNSDLIISRIAEMYLISAEAGNTNRLDELRAIRNSTITDIKDEFRLEMAFEWTRIGDLRLYNDPRGDWYYPYYFRDQQANPKLKKDDNNNPIID